MRKRVMVVDDNRDVVDTTVALLRARGFDAKACYDALDIVNCVREFEPDAILLDLAMPGKSGWEAAREVRAMDLARQPIIIVVTGEPKTAANQLLADKTGIDHFLTKAASPAELLSLLA